MLFRIITSLALIVALCAATNSSHSSFLIEFDSDAASSDALVSSAVEELGQAGFYEASDGVIKKLQYHNSPIWAYVSSTKHGQLELVFTQLRGGCGFNPKVTIAKKVVAHVRISLERKFGLARIIETNSANGSQSSTSVNWDSLEKHSLP